MIPVDSPGTVHPLLPSAWLCCGHAQLHHAAIGVGPTPINRAAPIRAEVRCRANCGANQMSWTSNAPILRMPHYRKAIKFNWRCADVCVCASRCLWFIILLRECEDGRRPVRSQENAQRSFSTPFAVVVFVAYVLYFYDYCFLFILLKYFSTTVCCAIASHAAPPLCTGVSLCPGALLL